MLAGFNNGEIRSLRFLLPPAPADAATYEKQDSRALSGSGGRISRAAIPRATCRRACSPRRATRCMAGPPSAWWPKQTALGAPSFLYYFDHGYPAADAAGLHAFHASELPYVFGTCGQDAAAMASRAFNACGDARSSDAMIGYWAAFARDGVPTAAGKPPWPAYGTSRSYMAFEDEPRPEDEPAPRHVRARRTGRVQTPRCRSHPVALECRRRLSATARRRAAVPLTAIGVGMSFSFRHTHAMTTVQNGDQ